MIKIKMLTKRVFTSMILSLIFVGLVSAAGVATSYWDDNPLKLSSGESTIISLRLQSDGGETILRATLDSLVAELTNGPDYTVPAGESIPVNIRVTIPKNAEIGTKYSIYVDLKEISTGDGGMVHVTQGITSKIPVEVVGENESELYGLKTSPSNNLLWIILAIIIIGITLFIIRANRKKR